MTEQRSPFAPRLCRAFHSYYEPLRLCSPRRYFRACFGLSRFSLPMREQIPTFRTPARTEVMPSLRRMPRGQSARSRRADPRGHVQTLVLTSSIISFDACSTVCFRSSPLPAPSPCRSRPGLLDQAAQGGFEVGSCKPTPRGRPSSGVQLRGTRTLRNI